MKRDQLKAVIAASCDEAGVDGEHRDRLVNSADGIDRIAFEAFAWKDKDGEFCGCPATVAGYWDTEVYAWTPATPESVRTFPAYFDDKMATLRVNGEIEVEQVEAQCLEDVDDPEFKDDFAPYAAVRIED